MITLTDREFNMLIVSAFRYALGRMTYIVSFTVDTILEHWDIIDEHFKEQFKCDIEHAIKTGIAGHDCDIREWRRILEKYDGR